jgi:hypothetical protein
MIREDVTTKHSSVDVQFIYIPSPFPQVHVCLFGHHNRTVELAGTGGIHLAEIPSLVAGLSFPYRPDCVDQQHF